MSDISFDFSEVSKLAADLGRIPGEAMPNIRKAVQVTAFNVKADWRRGANRTGLGGYAADITYETKESRDGVEAEVGPTIGDQGSFGLVEDATGNVRSSPQHAGRSAARKNEDDFVNGLLKAISDPLERL